MSIIIYILIYITQLKVRANYMVRTVRQHITRFYSMPQSTRNLFGKTVIQYGLFDAYALFSFIRNIL
jgi:hypothetical protein